MCFKNFGYNIQSNITPLSLFNNKIKEGCLLLNSLNLGIKDTFVGQQNELQFFFLKDTSNDKVKINILILDTKTKIRLVFKKTDAFSK